MYLLNVKCQTTTEITCEVIVEPSPEFTETYPLLMAPTAVDMNGSAKQKVGVLNPFDTEVSIKQDSVVGLAETFSNMKTLVQTEDETESGNYCSVRPINNQNCLGQFCKTTCHRPSFP